MAIAEATANLHYAEFLRFIGRHVIPRQSVPATVTSGERQTVYLKKIQNGRRQIAAAIRVRDVAAARRAMRNPPRQQPDALPPSGRASGAAITP